ncbi:DNA-3-methyladenine glycosylase I [Pasteurella testudinis DSM 23072]|uniref:DNA-3-methyladenine glycosylase I n=1 Tax=Pasteurella testudinis DSM 23072 TaxID=1122938 RepID=A0A1W1V3U8_9PAST|nr:DNA-3-methyladenine glycosylase I [Pasteurella testudinis]SMB87724.1 DNA-3-methyladenine glycosylase I [Pasteurella testudinis DSM 23072]SUB50451.1 3-methyladenine DNA glycosylase [Pasteurella testudinis]
MILEKFDDIYQRAAEQKGGEARLQALLCEVKSTQQLLDVPDHRWLAELTRKIFQSGFVWRIVNQKWDSFEQVFWGFEIEKLLMMPDELWEKKAQDPSIIRNWSKVATIKQNAQMIYQANLEGGFSRLLAEWDSGNITALWQYLKRNGKRLGGNTGAYTLRAVGKDTFLLTHDVEAYLRNHKLIDGGIQTQRSFTIAQQVFAEWQQQSGRPLSHISQIVTFSMG